MRDERVMAMGTLAAGAAHELGTPLATMALLAGELANDPGLSEPIREDIALIRQQIGVCKEIITGLSRRAGAERLENALLEAANRWLDSLRQRWHAARPQASSRLVVASDGAPPEILADPRLEQAILNPTTTPPTQHPAHWRSALPCTYYLCIDIRSRPRFPARSPAQVGKPASRP